jgi:hypothetical protein
MKPREYIHTSMNVHEESISLQITQLSTETEQFDWNDRADDDYILIVFFFKNTGLQNYL